MVSQGMFSIGGIASGLDTGSIVQQLMQLERRPMMVMEQRQLQHRRADEAWGQIVTRLSTLRTATNKLNDPTWLQKTTAATSSNDAVARVTTSGGATPGSLSFTVDALATTHQVALGGTFSSADAAFGEGEIVLTRGDGKQLTATLGEGATLGDAARALNDLDGISARVLRVADGQHRLIVTASETGTGAAFDVSGLGADASQTLTTGQDATIRLGDLVLRRSSNTVDDLVQGVTVQLTGTGTVTVDVRQNLDEGVKQVKGFVDALNGLLTQLGTATRASAEASGRGPLNGDPLARDLAMTLRGALSGIRGEGQFGSLSQIGISLTREGSITLDEAKLRNALAADPQGVSGLLGKASNASDPRVEVSAVGRAQPGTYRIDVERPAVIASVTGALFAPPTAGPTSFAISLVSGGAIEVTLEEGDSIEEAVARINGALTAAGAGTILASVRDGRIQLAAERAGASHGFTVTGSGDLGLDGQAIGASPEGTVSDGMGSWAFTGNGRSLSVNEGPAQGLVLRIPAGVTGDLGQVKVGDGLGSVIDRVLRAAEGSGGSIARARNAVQGRIAADKANIERFEQRLEIRERSIRRQFTAMESALAQFNAQGNWLAQQLGSMMG